MKDLIEKIVSKIDSLPAHPIYKEEQSKAGKTEVCFLPGNYRGYCHKEFNRGAYFIRNELLGKNYYLPFVGLHTLRDHSELMNGDWLTYNGTDNGGTIILSDLCEVLEIDYSTNRNAKLPRTKRHKIKHRRVKRTIKKH